MAHSHLPTWKPAQATGDTFDRGNFRTGGVGSSQRRRQDAAGYSKLKLRHPEQLLADADVDDLERREIQARILAGENGIIIEGETADPGKAIAAPQHDPADDKDLEQFDDRDDEVSSASEDEAGAVKGKKDLEEDDEDDDEDSDDSDSDDEEELARELERIKRARLEEAARKEAEEEEIAAKARKQEAMLLDSASTATGSTSTLKRRWDADVVFQNQASGVQAPKKRFINDTLRNDFHRSFLKKYIP